jgi:succinate-semialdehyde dehydrogenase/glutarate-semialdehyde dehydrogenase
MLQSINPYNNRLIAEFEEYNPADIEKILQTASSAFIDWKRTGFEERSMLLLKCASLLTLQIDQLAGIISLEMGKRIGESRAEIRKCAWVCEYYAAQGQDFLKDELLPVAEAESYVRYDPLGIILAIMPWNFPFWQVFRFAAPAIMAGNVGILKHASNVSQCALAIEKLFLDSGFPAGIFQSVLLSSGNVEKLINDERVKAVTLTGSEEAGKKVAECAGRNIKKTVLELGGSDPFIVLGDAEIEKAAKAAAKSRMINCGQSCIAAKRFIIQRQISIDFIECMISELRLLEPGDPLLPDTGYGPLARPDLTDILEMQVADSIHKGSIVLLGGKRPGNHSAAFYEPTVLSGVVPGMPAFDEELFGPVAAITVVNDEMDAIKMANHSRFGLGASLWTSDIEKARVYSKELESGSVFINDMVASHPAVPFGGVKMSGYGRELSHIGIREFMNVKSVWIRKN